MLAEKTQFVYAAELDEVRARGCTVVQLAGHTIALFAEGDVVHAVDNRCPHMGFPLDRGSVKDGILTCHWHHARFDLASGGTFDQFADDVRRFPTEVRDTAVWVDVAPHDDPRAHQRDRLEVGLERDIPLVIGKAVLVLLDGDGDPVPAFRAGLAFGARYRRAGWGSGLTILTALMNLLPRLAPADRPRALYQGLSAVARDSAGSPPRFAIRPLPGRSADLATYRRWFRQFVEVRDEEGAERCIVSAIRDGASAAEMSEMMVAAVTDHRYIDLGHPADFTNKAFEALAIAGWDLAEVVLTSLVRGYTRAARMEESNAWRHPIDLIDILDDAFERLPAALEASRAQDGYDAGAARPALTETLLGEAPRAIADALLAELAQGCPPETLAGHVAYAAALRIARFHTSNEFPDWDTALHTFTFANAVYQSLRRAPSPAGTRGVFDAAISVYLDRFLNVPAARLPAGNGRVVDPAARLAELPALLDRQQQVNQAASLAHDYLAAGGDAAALIGQLGALLLREDRDFHTIQTVETAVAQHDRLAAVGQPAAAGHVLIAAFRYLAAHAPTVRAQGQTYEIARRLHRGERLFEGD